ncbi:hypothetical protein [Legionella gresilensis]|uniref:hypothetical protein n=1 Tax=Legionella gresilensis TaxID=91823 RepID=UPI0010410001|nr:hypothetical protein [Legionella gresilensis]
MDEIQSKAISKAFANKILLIQSIQLARLTQIAQTNPLYRFFNYNSRFVYEVSIENLEKKLALKNSSQLPAEIFCCVNEYLGKANFYHRRAKNLIKNES